MFQTDYHRCCISSLYLLKHIIVREINTGVDGFCGRVCVYKLTSADDSTFICHLLWHLQGNLAKVRYAVKKVGTFLSQTFFVQTKQSHNLTHVQHPFFFPHSWSVQSLYEWGAYIRLGVAAMLMIVVEWWSYEISQFVAGLIGTAVRFRNGKGGGKKCRNVLKEEMKAWEVENDNPPAFSVTRSERETERQRDRETETETETETEIDTHASHTVSHILAGP